MGISLTWKNRVQRENQLPFKEDREKYILLLPICNVIERMICGFEVKKNFVSFLIFCFKAFLKTWQSVRRCGGQKASHEGGKIFYLKNNNYSTASWFFISESCLLFSANPEPLSLNEYFELPICIIQGMSYLFASKAVVNIGNSR